MPSDLFGGEDKQETVSNGLQPRRIRSRSGRSSADSTFNEEGVVNSSVTLDPIIERLRNESLSGFRSLIGSLNSDMDALRGNQNAFIEARVNPLEEQFAQSRGRLARDTSRRGVFGSLANNELERFDVGTGRALADQRALATNEALNAVLQREEFQRQLFGDVNTVGQQKLSEVLSTLGLQSNAAGILINGNSAANTGQTTTSSADGGILGKAGQVASLASAFAGLSDIRRKENIVYVGEENGYKIYHFNYIGESQRYKGVLAHEVEVITPEAVTIGDDGYKHVNYEMIGVTMEAV